MNDPGTKRSVQIAVGLSAAGFLLIVLGWNGAASYDRVPGQLPYVLSGGLAGIGLIAVGLTLALVNQLRRTTTEVLHALEQLGDRVTAVENAGPTAVPDDGSAVVAGRTTYHLPTCRLVAERTDLQTMSPEHARDRGLAPCRICEPRAATA
ncbi:hypothetical protein FTX61_09435 [Nitriliruptoraceae bacterium ZYF776]|nr:hypothetical protein [Profundirhabdus halotolerans]